MPDEIKKEETGIPWGTNDRGDLLIDGVVVEKNLNYYADSTSEVPVEDEPVEGKENAAVEGEEAKPELVPPKEPEKPEEPAPEPPKITEKQKYQLKIRGEMQEKEYTKDEIVARLQMAESYGIRNDELRKKHNEIEPFLHVFERPDFKEWLESKVAVGDIPAPTPPAPPDSDVIRYRLRTQEPEFEDIRTQMSEWAATLPDSEAETLNKDHRAFVEAYDHFKSARKATPSAPPVVPPKKEIEKSIANKEIIKQQARIEPPGGAPQEVDKEKEWHKVDRQLKKAVQNGERYVTYNGKRMDADTAWVMHRLPT